MAIITRRSTGVGGGGGTATITTESLLTTPLPLSSTTTSKSTASTSKSSKRTTSSFPIAIKPSSSHATNTKDGKRLSTTPKRRLSTSSSLALSKQSKQPSIGLDLSLSLPSFSSRSHHSHTTGGAMEEDEGVIGVGSASYKLKKEKGQLFPCDRCPKIYRSPACLGKHSWSHSLHWKETSKLLLSKHQTVQMLEAAAILVSTNLGGVSSLPDERGLWPAAIASPSLSLSRSLNLPSISSPRIYPSQTLGMSGMIGTMEEDDSFLIDGDDEGLVDDHEDGGEAENEEGLDDSSNSNERELSAATSDDLPPQPEPHAYTQSQFQQHQLQLQQRRNQNQSRLNPYSSTHYSLPPPSHFPSTSYYDDEEDDDDLLDEEEEREMAERQDTLLEEDMFAMELDGDDDSGYSAQSNANKNVVGGVAMAISTNANGSKGNSRAGSVGMVE